MICVIAVVIGLFGPAGQMSRVEPDSQIQQGVTMGVIWPWSILVPPDLAEHWPDPVLATCQSVRSGSAASSSSPPPPPNNILV